MNQSSDESAVRTPLFVGGVSCGTIAVKASTMAGIGCTCEPVAGARGIAEVPLDSAARYGRAEVSASKQSPTNLNLSTIGICSRLGPSAGYPLPSHRS